jgi:hypothetical protein
MKSQKRFLKNLETRFEEFRIILDKNNFESVNLYFQDESRFGLITKQKKSHYGKRNKSNRHLQT